MTSRVFATMAAMAVVLAAPAVTMADPSALPGDRGRPGDGVPAPPNPNGGGGPPQQRPPEPKVAALSADLALKATSAIAEGCKQFGFGVAIVNADGVATLVYVPDGAAAWHGYSAVRKAYTAVTFKTPTSQLLKTVQQDSAMATRVRADANLQIQSGGVPLKIGDTVIGAIGVSGAEPGGHDEECALIGINKIKDQLK